MNDLNTLLRYIHSRADSLAIFAKHAAMLNRADSTDTVQSVLDSLSVLQSLHTDLLAESHTIVMNPNAQKWLTRNWKAALKDATERQWDALENALNILEVCAPTDEERREYAFLGHLALTHLLRVRSGEA